MRVQNQRLPTLYNTSQERVSFQERYGRIGDLGFLPHILFIEGICLPLRSLLFFINNKVLVRARFALRRLWGRPNVFLLNYLTI